MSADKPDDTRTRDSDFAALWSSDGVTHSMSPTAIGLPADLPFLFAPGQRFGGYVIVRPLGKGGMGQVYEAEETGSGRRVALKLLGRGLGDDEERERFLREGQLAASLSHPNCVYVFGTSEIQGFPVIAMELVPQGTLKDLVVPDVPMTAAAAVDAILQVIAGLEAAAAIGILHRDIKPSNCFVHADGRVLIGDFGLSVAATSRDAAGTGGAVLGTPGFASPEQLHGDRLDVRSDIYSIGATIFYLLAGRPPFDDRDTTSLLKKVASEPPPSLTSIRPDLPRGLSAIVAKCLAKTAGERFATYMALRAALEPFGSARLDPAPIVRRTLAGMLDAWITGLPLILVNLLLQLQPLSASHRTDGLVIAAATVIFTTIYYALFEGLLGAGPGKALFGLRVADTHQVAPGVPRAAARALVFELPTQSVKQLVVLLVLSAVPDVSVGFVTTMSGLACLAILFSTARRKNGYLALHDRFTRTRVVRRRHKAEARDRAKRTQADSKAGFDSDKRIGPYLVPTSTRLDLSEPARIEAYDDRLKRRVWIELLPSGTPALPASRRDLGRPARLRWLAGRREAGESWDAYEAIDGVPFEQVTATRHQWFHVRHWLSDLATETVAALEDGSLTVLDPRRVRLGQDDHLRILEWAAPGESPDSTRAPAAPLDLAAAQRFLYGIATAALTGTPFDKALTTAAETPLPLNARSTLLSLRDAKFRSGGELLGAVSAALASPAVFPKSRRAVQITLCAALPVVMTAVSLGAIFVLRSSKAGNRSIFTLDACLNELERTEKRLKKGPDPVAQQTHDDVEIYMAAHLAQTIDNEATWGQSFPSASSRGGVSVRAARWTHTASAPRRRSGVLMPRSASCSRDKARVSRG